MLVDKWIYNTDTREQWGSAFSHVTWGGRKAGVQGETGETRGQEAEEAQFPVPGLPGSLGF